MPSLTPTRVRLTLSQKVKIIEESKKSDFSRKKICEEFSEVAPGLLVIQIPIQAV